MAACSRACMIRCDGMETPIKFSKAEKIWDGRAILGEGPVWDERNQVLYWLDIKGKRLYRTDPARLETEYWYLPEMIGCVVKGESETFLAGAESGFAEFRLGDPGTLVSIRKLHDPEPHLPGNRFNDGKRAPDGSFWAGTMDNEELEATGSWWRLGMDGNVTCVDVDRYRVTNGPAFDAELRRVYLTDSATQKIYCAEWQGSEIRSKALFHQAEEGDGYPDGMTVSRDGTLWVAFWDGACIRRFDRFGNLIQTIDVPARRPTSVCFSPDETTLYLTTASIGIPDTDCDGALFRLICD